MKPSIIDVAQVIEQQKPGRFTVRLVLISWLVTFFDGYDMNVIAFAAPYLAGEYGLDTLMLGNLFSIGVAGTILGGFLFGYIGDRIGRRRAIILVTALFGGLTLALGFADDYREFLVLRFLNGIALGGALPLIWALSIEYVPRRFRATAVTLIMLGYSLGVATAGPISVFLIPRFGWPAVFVFGGAASLVSAALLYFVLPESLRFMVTREMSRDAIARGLRRLAPGLTIPPDARFVISDEAASARGVSRLAALFQGELALITPLLWLAFIASSMATYFYANWGPLVFEGLGLSRHQAAWVTTLNSVAGALGGLALMRFTDRLGPVSVAALPAISVPLLLVVGLTPMGLGALTAFTVTLKFFLGGAHFGITSIAGLFYPTAGRGSGAGWAASVAKIGSVAGPWLGGYVLASGLAAQKTFAVLAICPAVFAASVFAIVLVQRHARRQAVLAPVRDG
ncbi:MAG: MFS transporter [Pseudomonadota bacterium]|nr:MAG: MFS transporter [Pseudomonadota bacterium]